ncbi:YebC/PmpR family DNA-binding transcriptional regulator [bacterium AH-315-J21]|nr:YebC/PmpR family DNA-binding transcriptional regulator [bacterium AH-315-J21]
MSGHSKWSTIKRKKGKLDAARGKIFTKLIREITVAARNGGGDESANPRLRTAVLSAKAQNMPADNIKRGILKGTGEIPGVVYEETTYEGYGPGGVALYLECMTDNKQRTVADIRHLLSKYGGNLGENGCVGYLFQRQGQIQIPTEGVVEEALMELALDKGAENFENEGDMFSITTGASDMLAMRDDLEAAGFKIESSETIQTPSMMVTLDEDTAIKFLKLYDALDDCEDVQKVWGNFDIPDDVMAKLSDE